MRAAVIDRQHFIRQAEDGDLMPSELETTPFAHRDIFEVGDFKP
jgi:hypothetical protein